MDITIRRVFGSKMLKKHEIGDENGDTQKGKKEKTQNNLNQVEKMEQERHVFEKKNKRKREKHRENKVKKEKKTRTNEKCKEERMKNIFRKEMKPFLHQTIQPSGKSEKHFLG